jgi:oligopeptidase B
MAEIRRFHYIRQVTFPYRGPDAPQRPHRRELHGEVVEDPWFWMRDHDDQQLLRHLEAERRFHDDSVRPLDGLRADIAARLHRRVAREDHECPWTQGGLTYQRVYPEGAQYPQWVRWRDDPATARTVLDLGVVAGDAPYAETGLVEPSDDGRVIAYSVDLTGDEVYELRFRDVESGSDLPDRVPHTYYGGAFTSDGGAFYYTVHDDTYRPYQVWRHRLGEAVDTDELVLEEADRRFELDLRRTRSGDVVLVSASSRRTRQEWALDAHDPRAVPRPVRDRVDGVEDHVEHQRTPGGGRWLVVTNERSREFSLVACELAGWTAGAPVWTEPHPAREGHRLASCDAFAGHVVLGWRADARPHLEVWRSGGPSAAAGGSPALVLRSPGAGTLRPGPNGEYDADGLVVERTSLVDPSVWSSVPFAGGPERLVHETVAPGHDAARYVTERTTLTARDGTEVPVTMARAVDTPLDGSAPGVIWAYGAYESCDWPEFDPVLPEWLDRGVVYVHAHVRGGGEGGRTWWEQGRMEAKTTTFTDLVDVADGLAARGLVAPDRIATRGLSAGGLLQGAVFTTRPDRWRVVVAEVPFVDCVNSMLDDSVPLTVGEWEEWGDPHRPEDYRWMRAYTPYENLPEPPWPDLLVTGALHDPRVLVHEPAKWVARLRSVHTGDSRLLFRAETGPGAHGGPSGRFAHLDYEAEVMAFVLDALDHPTRPRGG